MNIKDAIKIMKFSIKNEIAKAYLHSIEENSKDLTKNLSNIIHYSSSWKGPQATNIKTYVKTWIRERETHA
jgi:hypothetical protein